MYFEYFLFLFSTDAYDLGGERKYLSNMEISVCLEDGSPCTNIVDVLKDTLLPKLDCDWNFQFDDPSKINNTY